MTDFEEIKALELAIQAIDNFSNKLLIQLNGVTGTLVQHELNNL
ncbi:hypothetical protein [Bacillus mycoides]|nr:hypothetical protein [Bacillus mycoides]